MKRSAKEIIAQKLDELMSESRDLSSQQKLAKRVGIGQTTIGRIRRGEVSATVENLKDIADAFGVAMGYLFGETDKNGMPYGITHLGEFDAVPGLATVPLISWVQAGHWKEAFAQADGEEEQITTTYRKRKYTYALRVRGDSMEPKFPQGAILIVEPEETPESGAYVIVRQNGGEATFKQLMVDGDVKLLKPLNPRYPIMQMNDDAEFCGVVKRVEMDV